MLSLCEDEKGGEGEGRGEGEEAGRGREGRGREFSIPFFLQGFCFYKTLLQQSHYCAEGIGIGGPFLDLPVVVL